MTTISITVPDTLIPRIQTAMRALFPQYAALTDAQCFRRITADQWRAILANYEADNAYNTAQTQANSDGSGIG